MANPNLMTAVAELEPGDRFELALEAEADRLAVPDFLQAEPELLQSIEDPWKNWANASCRPRKRTCSSAAMMTRFSATSFAPEAHARHPC